MSTPPSAASPVSVRWARDLPLAVFAAVEMYALVLWLAVGRHGWFYLDEWDFLVNRKAGDVGDLFRSHNGHWVTVPVLAYRFLYWGFGLRAYLPFRLVVVLLYLTAAALLLVVMRRARTNPWIATAAASLFVLFGSGWANILRPFQMTFVGSLVFGLIHMMLADHDGPFDRRDWFGLLAGLLALMTSGVGVVMIVAVGLSVWLRRGGRLALLHTVPLAGCYLVWRVVIGHEGDVAHDAAPGGIVRFVASGLRGTFAALGPVGAYGVLLAVVLVAGFALAVAQRRPVGHLAELAVPVALLGGAVALLAFTATSRAANGTGYAQQSRYLSLVAAMTLPALAVAADALATRWRWFLPVAVALFVVGIPANIHAGTAPRHIRKSFYAATKRMMSTIPRDPLARRVPRSLVPERIYAEPVTVGWLLDALEEGRIPGAGELTSGDVASDAFRLSFDRGAGRVPSTNCFTIHAPQVLALRPGDAIGIYDGALLLTPAADPVLVDPGLLFTPSDETPVVVLRDPGRVRLAAYDPSGDLGADPSARPPRVCVAARNPDR